MVFLALACLVRISNAQKTLRILQGYATHNTKKTMLQKINLLQYQRERRTKSRYGPINQSEVIQNTRRTVIEDIATRAFELIFNVLL
jgi:hypothetical protein